MSWINARNDDPLYRDEAWEELEAYLHGGEDNSRRERYRAGERHERTAASTPFPADIRQALFDLELEPGVSAQQIRSAYRRLLLKYHPDRFHSDTEQAHTAAEVTQRISMAYKRLSDYYS